MEVFSTSSVPRESRAAFWNAVYTDHVAPVHVEPQEDGRFDAQLKVGVMGPVEFACVRSRPTRVERKAYQARRMPERLISFVVLLRGRGFISHCGQACEIEAGDIVLTDNTQPIIGRYEVPMEGIALRVRETEMQARLPSFDALCGKRLPAGSGLTDLGVAMAASLSEKLGGELSAGSAAYAAGHLIDILAASYALVYGSSAGDGAHMSARHARVSQFIEENLSDPELSPGMIAASLRISPRYLRKLMAEQGETASSYILRRRLEECAKALGCDPWRSRSITDVAFSWGFNSTAHFARVFKARYGLSPRDFRRLGGVGSAQILPA